MTTYICKCGRQVKKATNADNTGNRDTKGCNGCPYLLPWGPDKYIEGQGFTKDVQGYECRMSPTISYTTTYRGQALDKCTLHILSLDLDFLDEVQAWIYDNAADTLSAGFSRGSMRGIDFSDKGRYSLSISCAQNKKGMAAKAALIEHFFTGGRVRKDMTLAQEKAHILAAIQRGKEQAQRKDQPMKKQNDRCPLQQECERTCKVIGHERDCDYYVNNRYSTGGIPDQDELLTEEELRQEREWEERYLASLSAEPAEPVVYQNEYGTLFAVREHKGAPALMCKAKEADSWALSGVLAAVQGEAYTAADQQEVLDEYARAHGWEKAAPEQTKEDYSPCEGCRCPDCDDKVCPQAHCDKSDKGLGCIAPDGLCPPVNPTAAAVDVPPCAPTASDVQISPSPNADAGAKEGANDGKADWAASQNCPFYDVKEYSDNSEGHFCHLCGSLKRPHKVCLGKYKDDWHKCDVFIKYDGAEQLLNRNASSTLSATIQTTPTSVESSDIADDGIAMGRPCPGDVYRSPKSGQLYKIGELTNGKKTCYLTMRSNAQGGTWVPVNSSVYPKLSDAQGEFEAWIRTEQLEPAAPTGDAAATTVERAVKEQPRGVEISTTSESGADASTPLSESSSTQGPNSSPAPASRADAGAADQSLSAAGPASLEADERMENPTSSDVATVAAGGTVASLEPSDSTSMMAAPAAKANEPKDDATESVLAMASGLTTFDFGADAETNAALMQDAQIFMAGSMARVMAAKRAHDRTANNYRGSWGKWCDLVGISRDTGDNMVRVAENFGNMELDGKPLIEVAPFSLLAVAAKPSAPAELVQAVKDGDITTHKQYQEALAEIRARDAKINDLLEMSEAADRRVEEAERMRQDAQQKCEEAIAHIEVARNMQIDTARERDEARRREAKADARAREAEEENSDLRRRLQEMEERPRDVAVMQPSEDQIEAWRREGAERLTDTVKDQVSRANKEKLDAQRQVVDLQKQLEESRPDADACQRTVDILYETTENLRLLLRSQLKQARLSPNAYGKVVAHVLQAARNLMDTVRVCSPDGYDMDSEEDDDFE